MNDVRISYFSQHWLAHELWEILTIGSPIRYESHPGILADPLTYGETHKPPIFTKQQEKILDIPLHPVAVAVEVEVMEAEEMEAEVEEEIPLQ